MKAACMALAATMALATTVPAEAGGRGGYGGGHGGYGTSHGRGNSGPAIGAKAGAQVAAKLSVLNIVKVKAGVGLGLGLGLGGR